MASSSPQTVLIPDREPENVETLPASPQPERKPTEFVIKVAGAIPL